MSQPLVTIIIPAFNRASLIGETLDSIIGQTYPHWECIVIDDGSEDGTQEVVKSYVQKEGRIQFWQRTRLPKGAPTCRNMGLEVAKGDYIIFFDSDDLFAPDCLERRVKTAQQQELDFYLFQGGIFSEKVGDNPNVIGTPNKTNGKIGLAEYLEPTPRWCNPSALWQKEAILKLGWDESLKVWQDVDLYIRAIIDDFQFDFYDLGPDFYWRHHFDDKHRISNKRFSSPYIESKLSSVHKLLGLANEEEQTLLKKIMAKDMFHMIERNAIESQVDKQVFRKLVNLYLPLVQSSFTRSMCSAYFRVVHFFNRTKIPFIKGFLAKTVGRMLLSSLSK
ncbi:MAG: glycosyltransferase [Saprospiraceae bacterium]|nr:glycosyltransferase [Saprospiraceae bacterium]